MLIFVLKSISMSHFIDITNRHELGRLLSFLKPDTMPLWGNMTAQHMVEHLITEIEYTNGKRSFVFDIPAEEAEASKRIWIFTDLEIPHNLVLSPPQTEYRYPDLNTAKQQLLSELDALDNHFETSHRTENHGAYGALNYAEWLNWLGKHFTHHLKQFGLI
jgi:hypothetical protein